MSFNDVNIEEKLIVERNQLGGSKSIMQLTQSIIENGNHSNQFTLLNKLYIDKLEIDRIYHIDTIRKICIDYRLRFLDRKYYKIDIAQEAQFQIDQIENTHQTCLHSFKIMAPAKALKLKNADDPLLFIPIGNDYYYLIHKWGNNLNSFRKWFVLPFKNLGYMLVFTILLSILTTYLLPLKSYGNESKSTIQLITFLFIFKSYCAVILYYCFWKGKNFSAFNWNSEYYN
ncbi:hypothetical protein [Flavobacterium sp.]|uniref:hypothetical protein n=1 Tax=Flavobacterium sp. TaxID=239 RepID=UPI00260E3FC3|nr:hypothetical protein [Flavobacterium sp.]